MIFVLYEVVFLTYLGRVSHPFSPNLWQYRDKYEENREIVVRIEKWNEIFRESTYYVRGQCTHIFEKRVYDT